MQKGFLWMNMVKYKLMQQWDTNKPFMTSNKYKDPKIMQTE